MKWGWASECSADDRSLKPRHPGHSLLRLADEHDALAALLEGFGEVRAGDLLLGLPLDEAHEGDGPLGDEGLDVRHQPVVVVAEPRRGWDAVAPVEEEADQPALVLQLGDVAGDEEPVHGVKLEGDVVCQYAGDGGHGNPLRPLARSNLLGTWLRGETIDPSR